MSDYDVVHERGCWGCEQSEDTDWEVVHCRCCQEQWLKKEK